MKDDDEVLRLLGVVDELQGRLDRVSAYVDRCHRERREPITLVILSLLQPPRVREVR
ncbi:MAG: hypothetical protein ACXVYY_00970 [Oryzihumus sp.]